MFAKRKTAPVPPTVKVMVTPPSLSPASRQIHLEDCSPEQRDRLLKTGVFVDGLYVPFADGSSLS